MAPVARGSLAEQNREPRDGVLEQNGRGTQVGQMKKKDGTAEYTVNLSTVQPFTTHFRKLFGRVLVILGEKIDEECNG